MTLFLPLVHTVQIAAALGILSQSLTAEVRAEYLWLGWLGWIAGFALDRFPLWQKRLRAVETVAVILFVTALVLDFFVFGYSLFVTIAHFLLLFQVFKLLGLKERKDCVQMLLLSFFQILSACTLSVDIAQGVLLFLWIPTAAAGLFWQEIARQSERVNRTLPSLILRPYRKLIMAIALLAIPLNVVLAGALFVAFPRLAFRAAFLGLGVGKSGYSEQVNLDETGVLQLNNKVALWLEIIPHGERDRWSGYLRGSTLDAFDGKKWSRSAGARGQTMYADAQGSFRLVNHAGKGLRQAITLVHMDSTSLFGSPYVAEILAPFATLRIFEDGSIRWARGLRKPLRYEVVSLEQLPRQRSNPTHENDLQLTGDFTRTLQLLKQMKGPRTGWARAKAIETYLRSNFEYSLSLGSQRSENPVEEFLFERRRGPCGYFASAMAVMLRLEKIPARVVAGYYKGIWNERVGQYLIREADAHAWVEAYFPGRGWVMFDPSPRPVALSAGQIWKIRAQEFWQYLSYQWDRSVVEYDLYTQYKVVEGVQQQSSQLHNKFGDWVNQRLRGFRTADGDAPAKAPKRYAMVIPLFMVGVIVLIGFAVMGHVWRGKRPSTDPEIAFYQAFLDEMARKGFAKQPSETGWEFADRLKNSAEYPRVQEITTRYYQTRFCAS